MTRLVIVGAGIQGAGLAQAAACAGYQVVLIERDRAGCATSSNSSKLIHGGLRYLESGQLALVRECLRERALLLKLAPDLVHLERLHIPIYHHSRRRSWQIRAGLATYWLLSGGRSAFGSIPAHLWPQMSGINTEKLQALLWFCDAQTDDLALTRAVTQSALDLGIELYEQSEVVDIDIRASGVEIALSQAGEQRLIQADAVANCTGPWCNQLLERVSPTPKPVALELVQGSHLLLSGTGINERYYLESPSDGRAIFALPWHPQGTDTDTLLLGTTETSLGQTPNKLGLREAERDYLLTSLEHYFPSVRTGLHIESHYCGMRVLPKATGSAFTRQRELLVQIDGGGRLLSACGGKLTSYRSCAQKLLRLLQPKLGEARAIARTDQLWLNPVEGEFK